MLSVSFLLKTLRRLLNLVFKTVTGILRLVVVILDRTVFRWVLKIMRYLDYPIRGWAKKRYAKKIPIQDNKVVFVTFQGTYSCNPRMIAEKLLETPGEFEIVWVVKENLPTKDYPVGIHFVKYNTLAFYQELASAHFIIENTNILERLLVYKKPGQICFQTWHGSLGIKRLDGDVVRNANWRRIARRSQKIIDYMLCNSDFDVDVFREAYWKDAPEYLMYGHPRNDIFFWDKDRKQAVIEKVYDYLGVPRGKKLFLYAPTHTDDVDESFSPLPYEEVAQVLQERFGGEWQIVVRAHNRLKKESRTWFRNLPACVSDATMYDDMQDLLVAADAGLTDYSSWIFDYMLSRKPAFIITLHLDVFAANRGFYYPLESTPFPIAPDVRALLENIRAFDEKAYSKDIDRFLAERGCMEDGHASERVANKLRELKQTAVS